MDDDLGVPLFHCPNSVAGAIDYVQNQELEGLSPLQADRRSEAPGNLEHPCSHTALRHLKDFKGFGFTDCVLVLFCAILHFTCQEIPKPEGSKQTPLHCTCKHEHIRGA